MFAKLKGLKDRLTQGLEDRAARLWDGALRHPLTLGSLGWTLSGLAEAKAGWDRALEQSWAAWRLPSAHDVERLFARIDELERALERVDARFDARAQEVARARDA